MTTDSSVTTEPTYQTKDGGSRQQLDSGMHRELKTGQPRFDLLLPLTVNYDKQLLTRTAALVERGSRKYSARDWEQANSPHELELFRASAFRHFIQWMTGETDEDHAAAVVFNIIAAETTTHRIDTDAQR